ncbi:MAG TPA: glycoside hydrolase domain-containing protein, partial [Anaerovoracaceae bacterium]|nr:glycoside hydrolase domain-containing protein [Anaerovoracaceae bacterium]
MALGCDTATTLTAVRVQSLVNNKYTFAGRYLGGSYAMSLAEAKRISNAGLYIVSIWEKGRPTRPAYFTDAQGTSDGQSAITAAKALGQPAGTPIYFTVDYDASLADIKGPITIYLQAIKKVFEGNNNYYELGLYGSGSVLNYFKNTYTHTWLAGATAWSGSSTFTGWFL